LLLHGCDSFSRHEVPNRDHSAVKIHILLAGPIIENIIDTVNIIHYKQEVNF